MGAAHLAREVVRRDREGTRKEQTLTTHLVVVKRQAQLAFIRAQMVLHEIGVLGKRQPIRARKMEPCGPV